VQRTYSQLEGECNQAANALFPVGIKKYDRVAILAHNTHHHVLTWLETAKIGGIHLAAAREKFRKKSFLLTRCPKRRPARFLRKTYNRPLSKVCVYVITPRNKFQG
jgi:acyl-CoA synthetase (AMP-forming)/AMP-acid ligase II